MEPPRTPQDKRDISPSPKEPSSKDAASRDAPSEKREKKEKKPKDKKDKGESKEKKEKRERKEKKEKKDRSSRSARKEGDAESVTNASGSVIIHASPATSTPEKPSKNRLSLPMYRPSPFLPVISHAVPLVQ